MEYFGDYSMFQLISEMEGEYHSFEKKSHKEGNDKDPEIMSSIRLHDMTFRKIIPVTVTLIGTYIRNNSSELIQFE
jgi:hypothetical protein